MIIFTRYAGCNVKSTNPPFGGYRIADELYFQSARYGTGSVLFIQVEVYPIFADLQ